MGAEMSEEWQDSPLMSTIRRAIRAVDREALFTQRDEVARAVLSAIESAGYVIVPKDPTEEMMVAAQKAQGDHSNPDEWLSDYGAEDARKLYGAMLSARPKVTPLPSPPEDKE